MKSRTSVLVSCLMILVISFTFNACPSEACLKKVRALLRNKGRSNSGGGRGEAGDEKPAELAHDEASFIKYSHAERSNFYIEIMRLENKTIIVRELDHPPIAKSQVMGDEFMEKKMEGPEEPDAEYIDVNKTAKAEEMEQAVPIPPERNQESSGGEQQPPKKKAKPGEEEESEEEILAPEDEIIRREWGGKCMAVHWKKCNKIRQIVVLDVINNQFQHKNLELDCLLEPILCLANGWTANRCHILCMASQCNKQLYFEWDSTVDFEGPCRYRKK